MLLAVEMIDIDPAMIDIDPVEEQLSMLLLTHRCCCCYKYDR